MKNTLFRIILICTAIASFGAHADYEKSNESFFSLVRKVNTDGTEIYFDNLDLKKYRKFGIGTSIGGANGLLGLNAEVNLEPENALIIGLGTGPSYGSFNLAWKRNFESDYLSPYFKVGYAKWFGTSNRSITAGNSDILKRVLSSTELRTNQFNVDFLTSSLGVEYNQLEGELAGVNFFGELVLLTDIGGAITVPAGAVGLTYFY